jgi:hypothetical protein
MEEFELMDTKVIPAKWGNVSVTPRSDERGVRMEYVLHPHLTARALTARTNDGRKVSANVTVVGMLTDGRRGFLRFEYRLRGTRRVRRCTLSGVVGRKLPKVVRDAIAELQGLREKLDKEVLARHEERVCTFLRAPLPPLRGRDQASSATSSH